MAFAAEVSSRIGELSPAEVEVAGFLTAHPHRIGHLSAARIAEAVGTSDATVIRTVRKLGYDGLASLREALASELSLQGRLETTLAHPSGKQPRVRQLVDQRIAAVAALPTRVGDEALVAAVAVLAAAKRVCLVGFGPAGHIAAYAAHQFRRVGVPATTVTSTGRDLADDLTGLARGDAIVLLAYDGTSLEVEVLLDRAEHVGAPVVLLNEDPTIADRRSAVVLPVGRGDPTHSASHATTVAVLESLVLAVAARHQSRADQAGHLLDELRQQLVAKRRPRGRR